MTEPTSDTASTAVKGRSKSRLPLLIGALVIAGIAFGAGWAAGGATDDGELTALRESLATAHADRDAVAAEASASAAERDEALAEVDRLSADAEERLESEPVGSSGSSVADSIAALVGGSVTGAEETEPGRVAISTSIIDPREVDGGESAAQAIALCERALAIDGVERVVVFENDGSTFVVAGHPSYGPDCIEV